MIAAMSGLHRGLVVHGNYLTKVEQQLIVEHPNLSLVFCPRTHKHFHHGPHPWRAVQQAGGRVVLGTDGRGSNPDLSIWRELQMVAAVAPDISAQRLLAMLTTDAAEALGLAAADHHIACGNPIRGTLLDCRGSDVSTAEELLRDVRVQPCGSLLNHLRG